MRASTWPLLTICPSVNSTSVSTPDTCGTRVAVMGGVTVPSASISTGRSPCTARVAPTVTPPPPPPPPGPGPKPPGAPPAAGARARCTRATAPATMTAISSSVSTTPASGGGARAVVAKGQGWGRASCGAIHRSRARHCAGGRARANPIVAARLAARSMGDEEM
jgi:hypothetical protein